MSFQFPAVNIELPSLHGECELFLLLWLRFRIYLSGKPFVGGGGVFIGEGENQQLFMGCGGHTQVESAGSQTGLSWLLISLSYLFHQGSNRFTLSAVWRCSRSTVAHQYVCV